MASTIREIHALSGQDWTPSPDPKLWRTATERLELEDVCHEEYLLEEMFKFGNTGVYTILGKKNVRGDINPSLVIVYRQHCASRMYPLHTSVVDYWFLRHLADSDIVPKVYQLSAAMSATTLMKRELNIIGAVRFDRLIADPVYRARVNGKVHVTGCPSSSPLGTVPELRYIVTEKVNGVSVSSVWATIGAFPVQQVVNIGIEMISTLRRIHAMNVVHGDASFGNFLFNPDSQKVLKVIDFERARIFNEEEMLAAAPACMLNIDSQNRSRSRWYSPWNSLQCIPSFRDDIYRVFISLAALIYGHDYMSYFNRVSSHVTHTLQGHSIVHREMSQVLYQVWTDHRFGGEIFYLDGLMAAFHTAGQATDWIDFKTTFYISEVVPEQISVNIRDLFSTIEKHIIGLGLTDRPDYDFLILILSDISALLDSANAQHNV